MVLYPLYTRLHKHIQAQAWENIKFIADKAVGEVQWNVHINQVFWFVNAVMVSVRAQRQLVEDEFFLLAVRKDVNVYQLNYLISG